MNHKIVLFSLELHFWLRDCDEIIYFAKKIAIFIILPELNLNWFDIDLFWCDISDVRWPVWHTHMFAAFLMQLASNSQFLISFWVSNDVALSWYVWILITSWFPLRGWFFSSNNFLFLTFWNLKNQTPPGSRDAGKSCDLVKVKTKTRFKATFQIRIPVMIHNSLRLRRQDDSFCENFLIWVRNTPVRFRLEIVKKWEFWE